MCETFFSNSIISVVQVALILSCKVLREAIDQFASIPTLNTCLIIQSQFMDTLYHKWYLDTDYCMNWYVIPLIYN